MTLPTSKAEALKLGIQTFFTWRPCKNGHIAARYASSYECLTCVEHKSKRRWKTNKISERARIAKWRSENAAHLKKYNSAKNKAWREANLELSRKIARDYQRANKQARAAYYAEWKAKNPGVVQSHVAARRARLLGTSGRYTPEQIQNLFVNQKGCCAACKVDISNKYHKDHIIPLTRGGNNDITNIQLLCVPCNKSKYNKLPSEWSHEMVGR